MLATYYKFNAEEAVEKTILENRLHDIAKNVEKQKARLKNEEIPYHLYLEFLADFEKEKKEITDQLAKCSKGVVQRIGTSLQNCQFHTYWSKIKYLTSDSNVHCFN